MVEIFNEVFNSPAVIAEPKVEAEDSLRKELEAAARVEAFLNSVRRYIDRGISFCISEIGKAHLKMARFTVSTARKGLRGEKAIPSLEDLRSVVRGTRKVRQELSSRLAELSEHESTGKVPGRLLTASILGSGGIASKAKVEERELSFKIERDLVGNGANFK